MKYILIAILLLAATIIYVKVVEDDNSVATNINYTPEQEAALLKLNLYCQDVLFNSGDTYKICTYKKEGNAWR